MKTFVREFNARVPRAEPRAKVEVGVPIARVGAGHDVTIVFGPGTVVAYRLRLQLREQLFVFRTLQQPEPLGTRVPGVRPRVRLLMLVHNERRIQRALSLMRALRVRAHKLERLSDEVFLRANHVLGRRAPIASIADSLLRVEVWRWIWPR